MAFGEKRWSTAQRAAVVAAVLDQGMSNAKAARAAAAGELGLPPFPIPKATVADYTATARRRRAEREQKRRVQTLNTAHEIALQTLERMMRRLDFEAGKLERSGAFDPSAYRELAGAVREVLAAEKTARAMAGAGAKNTPNHTHTNGRTQTANGAAFLQQLANHQQD